jgi:hypothetical protein
MKGHALYATIGLLIFAGIVAAALASPVYADRGRDEAFYLTIHELPVAPGAKVTQPVPLQRPDASAIEVPYRWLNAEPAIVQVRLVSATGATMSDRQEAFSFSRGSKLLQPTGNGTVWQDQQAAFKTIALPSGLSGTVVLSMTRVDQTGGTLILFASDTVPSQSNAGLGTQPDKRPPIVERPSEVLDVETEYGALQPAVVKVPKYLSRIASIAPPWIPAPIFVLLFIAAFLIALYLFTLVALTQPLPESNDQSRHQPSEPPGPRPTAG